MLIKNFYTVVAKNEINESDIHVTIKFHKEHAIFEGHFPGNPVTPGVCMIQIIKELIQDHFNGTLFLHKFSNIKFTALINPYINSELLLEISFNKVDNLLKVKNISKFTDGTIALKCNGTFILQ
jgi:3-hydroxyacyl-[acyl-carrier-protein] dehydratase